MRQLRLSFLMPKSFENFIPVAKVGEQEKLLQEKSAGGIIKKREFNEEDQPRDEQGKFAETDGDNSSSSTVIFEVGSKEALKNVFNDALTTENSSTIVRGIVENHEALGKYTPEEMKKMLEEIGHDVKPLGNGKLKGVPFEDGGRFRINFDGDGSFRYHPEKGSHHGGAYWRINCGKEKHIYDTTGTEIRN